MTKKLITILGITGTQGGSVATRFLANPEWRVRGLTRNPGSDKAKAWASKGVEIFKGDHDHLDSLKTAFRGAHAIFAVTDWAGNYSRVSQNKTLQDEAQAAGRSPEEYAGDLEKAQGITIARAASDPCVLATLERYIFSTLPAVRNISGGKYTHSWEFDSKAGAESYIRQELPELNARLSTVTMGIFQETWRDIPAFRPHKLADGSFEYVRLKTSGTYRENAEVVASLDTGAFVEALAIHHPPGTDVLGASQMVTKEEQAALWGRLLGVEARVRDVSEEEYLGYIPQGFELTILDDVKFFAEYGFAGGNPRVRLPTELGIQTTPLAEYYRSQDWSAVLKGEM
ncbi:hypothetical protein B0I35DRAFT_438215 [Stachybotrys elegans]|uniref:NmrA-like domain-containing protein n=1 Tax=Stachybotrys elegans TaxID=80388 RepID=A0A8K0SLF5_9HYPO|nr:hypothetical protein B0I35DRAFT_438215 [Stachybotrys elegans]